MGKPSDDENPSHFEEMKKTAGFLVFATACIAGVHALFWRWPGTMGKRYPGLAGFLGVIFYTPLMASVAPMEGEGVRYIWWYWNTSWILFLFHAVMSSKWNAPARNAHTGYIGDSLIEKLFPSLKRDTAMFGEIIGSVIIGAMLIETCVTVAVAVIVASIVNLIHYSLVETRQNRSVDRAINSRWEAQDFAQRVRGRWDD